MFITKCYETLGLNCDATSNEIKEKLKKIQVFYKNFTLIIRDIKTAEETIKKCFDKI